MKSPSEGIIEKNHFSISSYLLLIKILLNTQEKELQIYILYVSHKSCCSSFEQRLLDMNLTLHSLKTDMFRYLPPGSRDTSQKNLFLTKLMHSNTNLNVSSMFFKIAKEI